MITAEELENFDVFPKTYSLSCVFRTIFFTFFSFVGFISMYLFFTDKDISSLFNFEFFEEKIPDINYSLGPNYLSNTSKFNQNLTENFINNFLDDYVKESFPCIIKDTDNILNLKKLHNYLYLRLNNSEKNNIKVEIRKTAETQFFYNDYSFLLTDYKKFKTLLKDNNNIYYINELNLNDIFINISSNITENFFKNFLFNINVKYYTYSEGYKNIYNSGHYENDNKILCLLKGELQFILIQPNEGVLLYEYTDLNGPLHYSPINFFEGNSNKYKFYKHANRIFITLSKNDCLYIPAKWWFAMKSTDKINTKFITAVFDNKSKYFK